MTNSVRSVWLLVLVLGWLAGCASQEKRQAEMFKAFATGQEQAEQKLKQRESSVTIRGPVKNPVLAWSEGLKLSQALVAAEYTGISDPRNIMVIRQGQVFQINPRRLTSGQTDVDLLPGDIVELVR